MSSQRDQIIQAIVDCLNQVGHPDDFIARRYSLLKIDFERTPEILVAEVHPGKDTPERPTKAQALLLRTLLVQVDMYGMGDPIDGRLDPSLCWLTAKLNEDRTLGGLALDMREGPAEWDEQMGQAGIGVCKVYFEVDYTHNRNNQESKT